MQIEIKIPNLYVIVVTFNRLEYTKRTLDSLLRTVPEAHIMIFDNASTDGTKEYIQKFQEEHADFVTVGGFFDNKGWGTAMNRALKEAPLAAHYLLSNNDVEYKDGWFDKCMSVYAKYPQIGILGVWQHIAHGLREDKGDLLIKDDMPACGWLMISKILNEVGVFAERGPCTTRGGNGEDTNYAMRVQEKGYWVACLPEDQAVHIDGY